MTVNSNWSCAHYRPKERDLPFDGVKESRRGEFTVVDGHLRVQLDRSRDILVTGASASQGPVWVLDESRVKVSQTIYLPLPHTLMEESLVPIYSRDLEYYIDDGNVILLVETTLFKVIHLIS